MSYDRENILDCLASRFAEIDDTENSLRVLETQALLFYGGGYDVVLPWIKILPLLNNSQLTMAIQIAKEYSNKNKKIRILTEILPYYLESILLHEDSIWKIDKFLSTSNFDGLKVFDLWENIYDLLLDIGFEEEDMIYHRAICLINAIPIVSELNKSRILSYIQELSTTIETPKYIGEIFFSLIRYFPDGKAELITEIIKLVDNHFFFDGVELLAKLGLLYPHEIKSNSLLIGKYFECKDERMWKEYSKYLSQETVYEKW